jgi:hypothetical protein
MPPTDPAPLNVPPGNPAPAPPRPSPPAANPQPAPPPDASRADRIARKKARKELQSLHQAAPNRNIASNPKFDPGSDLKGFDERRYHAAHYEAAGKPVPETDADDL